MPSAMSVESVPSSDMYKVCTALPSLKEAMPRAAPTAMIRRATSAEFDDFCKNDDMLFLRLGQGTKRHRANKDAARDYLCFPGMTDGYSVADDSRSISESDYEGDNNNCVKVSNSARMFPPLSPQPMDKPQHYEREDELGTSQRDVYDLSPPPGYKRLKRVRAPSVDIDENMTVTAAMSQLLFPPEGHTSRLQRSRRRQIAVPKRYSQSIKCHHDLSKSLSPMGDGFSGDETQPQKHAKSGKAARAPRARAKRAKRSREASDSSGSNQSTSLFQHSPFNSTAEKRRKSKGEQPVSILRSLDVVSLGQEDKKAAQRAAAAAARAAEKSKDIARHIIPLRPMAGCTTRKPREPMSFGLDGLDFTEYVHEQGDGDASDLGEVVFDVVDSKKGRDYAVEAVSSSEKLLFLPSLRR